MLKEELETQLGVRVSMTFYVTANGMYVQGPYRSNREFCEMLKQDKLLMQSLREQDRLIKFAESFKNGVDKFYQQVWPLL